MVLGEVGHAFVGHAGIKVAVEQLAQRQVGGDLAPADGLGGARCQLGCQGVDGAVELCERHHLGEQTDALFPVGGD